MNVSDLRTYLEGIDAVTLLERAIGIPSVTGNEAAFASFLAEELEALPSSHVERFDFEPSRPNIWSVHEGAGASKSTLVKMVSGVYQPASGQMFLDGEEVTLASASSARDLGIEVVYQDLALAESQPVYMNMFLGRELSKPPLGLLDRLRMMAETERQIRDLDVRIPSARAVVRGLSGGQRQGIAIARATHWANKLVLMDEPTAALGVAETAKVESIIQSLRDRKLAILVVSHNLDQVFRISDRISVLRHGIQVGERDTRSTAKNEIVSMITGLA